MTIKQDAAACPAKSRDNSMRLYGLDTLRGLAAVLVVLLHAGVPYMLTPLPHTAWPAVDARPSPGVDGLVWWIECCIMPLFFALAGFFSAGLLVLRGPRKFFEHRTKRILYPHLAGCLIILPPCGILWIIGWMGDGHFVPKSLLHPDIPNELEADLYGTGHLWFLQYLYLYCLVLLAGSWIWNRFKTTDLVLRLRCSRARRLLERILLSPWKPLLPAILCALILFWDLRIVLGFYATILPVGSKLLYYSIYFATGVLLYRYHRSLDLLSRYGKRFLVAALGMFAVTLPLIHEHLSEETAGPRRLALAGMLALFAWLTTFGVMGVFLRLKRGHNPATRYLAEASYWVYLIHLPFVVLTQLAIARLPILTPVKFLVTGATAAGLSLLTYQTLVRYTWVGEFINGSRRKRGTERPLALPLAEIDVAGNLRRAA